MLTEICMCIYMYRYVHAYIYIYICCVCVAARLIQPVHVDLGASLGTLTTWSPSFTIKTSPCGLPAASTDMPCGGPHLHMYCSRKKKDDLRARLRALSGCLQGFRRGCPRDAAWHVSGQVQLALGLGPGFFLTVSIFTLS